MPIRTTIGSPERLKTIQEMKKRLRKNRRETKVLDTIQPYIYVILAILGIRDLISGWHISSGIVIITFTILAFLNRNHMKWLQEWVDNNRNKSDVWHKYWTQEKKMHDELKEKINAKTKKTRAKKTKS